MKLLDLFCGCGGCSVGYHCGLGDVDITGVDINPQPYYPYRFIQDDAMAWLRDTDRLREFDIIHISPPCQHYSVATNATGNKDDHDDLIDEVRDIAGRLKQIVVIENVKQAFQGRMIGDCIVILKGYYFNLPIIKERYFECFNTGHILSPSDPGTDITEKNGKLVTVAGNGQWARPIRVKRKTIGYGKECVYRHHLQVQNNITRLFKWASGVDWLPGDGYNHRKALANAIPPAYTEWIGRRLLNIINFSDNI